MAETTVAFGSGFPLPWGPAMRILKWILIGLGGLILLPIIGFGFLYITDPVHHGRLATVFTIDPVKDVDGYEPLERAIDVPYAEFSRIPVMVESCRKQCPGLA